VTFRQTRWAVFVTEGLHAAVRPLCFPAGNLGATGIKSGLVVKRCRGDAPHKPTKRAVDERDRRYPNEWSDLNGEQGSDSPEVTEHFLVVIHNGGGTFHTSFSEN